MQKGSTHLLGFVVAFVTGFALCYLLMSDSSDMRRRSPRKNQVARLTMERMNLRSLVTTQNNALMPENSLLLPGGIRRVETHVIIPNGQSLTMP